MGQVNTDGAFSHSVPDVASEGIIRDELGGFRSAFIFKGEEGDSLTAELWGCVHGLKIAWESGFRNIMLEIDFADALAIIKDPANVTHEDWGLVEVIKGVLE